MNKKLRNQIDKKLIRGTVYETLYMYGLFLLGLLVLVPCTLVLFALVATEVVSHYYS